MNKIILFFIFIFFNSTNAFSAHNYFYYIGPWVWDDTPGLSGWKPPSGSIGVIDLRPITNQNIKTLGSKPFGFFSTTKTLNTEYILLGRGDILEIPATETIKNDWWAKTGYRPSGTKLVDLLWDQVTNGSDPTGISGMRPLMPTIKGDLELYLGGHSMIKSEKFVYGVHPHTNKVKDAIQIEFRKIWASGRRNTARKYLGALTENKFKDANWKDFVPIDILEEVMMSLKPETTLTENFNTAQSSTLGPNQTWTEYKDGAINDAQWGVDSANHGEHIASVAGLHGDSARAEADLSSDDHYAQLTIVDIGIGTQNLQIGGACRFSASAATFYTARVLQDNDTFSLEKTSDGIITNIGAGVAITPSTVIVKVQADGSTIKSFYDGVEKHSVTDTSITGNTRAGFFGFGNSGLPDFDNWEASDLSVIGTVIQESTLQGATIN